VPDERPGSVNDYGCGYGALADYLEARYPDWSYCGLDVSPQMVAEARRLHPAAETKTRFLSDRAQMPRATYTVSSGIFNVKLEEPEAEWQNYVLATLEDLAVLSTSGFAFNVLTSCSDPACRRPDLFYADAIGLFEHCRARFSTRVALLHDYPLYEFTVLVRL
jgi:SAM-dependent methyltransferase